MRHHMAQIFSISQITPNEQTKAPGQKKHSRQSLMLMIGRAVIVASIGCFNHTFAL